MTWRVIFEKVEGLDHQDAYLILLRVEEDGQFRGRRRATFSGLDELGSGIERERFVQAAIAVAGRETRAAVDSGNDAGSWPEVPLHPSEVEEKAAAGAGRAWQPEDVVEEFD